MCTRYRYYRFAEGACGRALSLLLAPEGAIAASIAVETALDLIPVHCVRRARPGC